jgi:hypothetical protein
MATHNLKPIIAVCILLIACVGFVSATTITAQSGNISMPGDAREFPIIVDSLPNGLSGFSMTIALTNPLNAEITEAITPPWADIGNVGGTITSPSQHVSVMASSVNLSMAKLQANFRPADNLTLVIIGIQGVAQGSTGLLLTNVDIEDMEGNPISASIQNGTIVIGGASPTPTETVSPTPTETASPTPTETASPTPTETASPIETGSIDVQSNPAGGDVYLDGDLAGVTPVVITDITPGEYTILIQKDGYEPYENSSVIVSAGNTTQVSATLQEIASSGTVGSLDITSIPSDADVYLNDAFEGHTPLRIVNLEQGSYMLRIEEAGFDSWIQAITIVSGKIIFITAPLTPTPTNTPTLSPTPTESSIGTGGLYVVSEPTATVFVDGIEFGKSNEAIQKIPSGIRNVTLFKSGFIPKSMMVNIGINRVTVTAKVVLQPDTGPSTPSIAPTDKPLPTLTTVSTTLPAPLPPNHDSNPLLPATGGVFVYSVPFGCSVFIDDVYRGSSPNLFTSIDPGSHTVKLSLTGYQENARTVTVNAGDISMVTVMMLPDFKALVSALP